jgi:hypothetical protein
MDVNNRRRRLLVIDDALEMLQLKHIQVGVDGVGRRGDEETWENEVVKSGGRDRGRE